MAQHQEFFEFNQASLKYAPAWLASADIHRRGLHRLLVGWPSCTLAVVLTARCARTPGPPDSAHCFGFHSTVFASSSRLSISTFCQSTAQHLHVCPIPCLNSAGPGRALPGEAAPQGAGPDLHGRTANRLLGAHSTAVGGGWEGGRVASPPTALCLQQVQRDPAKLDSQTADGWRQYISSTMPFAST